jgi:hypothetical protein
MADSCESQRAGEVLLGLGVSAPASQRRRALGLRPVPTLPSRPSGFDPSRLRACGAARFACLQGKALRAIPAARAWRPSTPPNRLSRIGPASAPPHGQCSVGAPWLAAAGCANTCRPQRWRFSPITSRRTVHGHPARHRYGASAPRLKTGTARCGRGVLACRRVVDLARVSGRAGAAFVRECRVGPVSFRCGSAQGVLVLL